MRAVVTGVHGLEHVERRGVADLTDDDPVGAHAQAVLDQVADRDRALALDVGRARLEADDVLLLELELGGVLDGDDPLVVGDERRQHVEGRGLAGAGAAGDDDVEPAAHAGVEEVGASARSGEPNVDQVLRQVSGSAENFRMVSAEPSTASGGMTALTRLPSGRRASTIGLDSSTRRPIRDTILSMVRRRCASSAELGVGLHQPAVALEPDAVGAVDHDLGDVAGRAGRLDRAVAEDVVADLLGDPGPVAVAERPVLRGEHVREDRRGPASPAPACSMSAAYSCGPSCLSSSVCTVALSSSSRSSRRGRPARSAAAAAASAAGLTVALGRHGGRRAGQVRVGAGRRRGASGSLGGTWRLGGCGGGPASRGRGVRRPPASPGSRGAPRRAGLPGCSWSHFRLRNRTGGLVVVVDRSSLAAARVGCGASGSPVSWSASSRMSVLDGWPGLAITIGLAGVGRGGDVHGRGDLAAISMPRIVSTFAGARPTASSARLSSRCRWPQAMLSISRVSRATLTFFSVGRRGSRR